MPDGIRTVYLVFCSTNASTTQSYNGDVIFDEFAWVPNCDEILNTALAMATQKDYRILFITTASHASQPAYRIWKGLDEQGNQVPDDLHRIKINIHQAIKPGCNLLKSTDDLKKLVGERRFKFVYELEWLDDAYQGLTENLKASKSNQAGSIIFYNVNQAQGYSGAETDMKKLVHFLPLKPPVHEDGFSSSLAAMQTQVVNAHGVMPDAISVVSEKRLTPNLENLLNFTIKTCILPIQELIVEDINTYHKNQVIKINNKKMDNEKGN